MTARDWPAFWAELSDADALACAKATGHEEGVAFWQAEWQRSVDAGAGRMCDKKSTGGTK